MNQTKVNCTITIQTTLIVDHDSITDENFTNALEHVVNDYTAVPKDSPSFPSRTALYPVTVRDVSYEWTPIIEEQLAVPAQSSQSSSMKTIKVDGRSYAKTLQFGNRNTRIMYKSLKTYNRKVKHKTQQD